VRLLHNSGINKLLSNENIKAAIHQVRNYCFDTGCEYACITNGHEWIFFKTFEKGRRWDSLQAFVIRNLSFFSKEYTRAINTFSFTAITENSSLPILLTSSLPKDRGIYFPKEKIPSYSHTISSNKLAASLRPIVNHYFGVIGDNDTDFMERCYVSQRDYESAYDGMRTLIQDSLSPYFAEYGVQQLNDTGKGGQLGGRLTKYIKNKRKGEVLVLFGGKGAGKSTFIKRLLHHNPPRWLREHSLISIVDLLKTPNEKEVIRKEIWETLVSQLDEDRVMESDRSHLLTTLFSDRYDVAKKQDLSGLSPSSESYNLKLNNLISEWKADKIYCAKRLVEYSSTKGKGAIVVVDNTDQYDSNVQDFCFSSAQEISSLLNCIVLISMREERFFDSKIHGVLDAFQNSGFHISSPKPAEVFKKRLDYTWNLLGNQSKRVELIGNADQGFVDNCRTYLSILSREFSSDQSPLNNFLTACAHGDIRLSLDLFRSFVLSGYTNVEEMLSAKTWNFKIHQVIKPVMIPNRYFYDESLSDIPNIYQLRTNRNSSHFTGLRVLRKLAKCVDISSPSYYAIAELKAYFVDTFNMLEDLEKNVDMLLKHGFVESNNRLDTFSDKVDSLKITNYGLYMLNELSIYFTYMDLVCTDCGIYKEQTSNYLIEAAKKEYALFTKGDRLERIRVRLERVKIFIDYLNSEELRERDFYSLGMPENDMFTFKARDCFNSESKRVIQSARRQNR
jgi:GTPase SAR1 family protein